MKKSKTIAITYPVRPRAEVGLEGSAIGQSWQDAIGKVLEEGPIFERVGSLQLAGLLIAIWVRKDLRMHVGDLDVAAVACGFGRTIGRCRLKAQAVNLTLEEQAKVILAPRSNNEMDASKLKAEFPELLHIKDSLIKYVFEPNKKTNYSA